MNNTSSVVDKDELLQQLNDEKAILMIPVMVYLGILMIMGLFGNAMVCFYYGFKSRQSSNTVFIIAVAIYDLMVCGLSIPIEIIDLRLFYLFTNSGACKCMRFVNYFGALGSALTLLIISADRYRKICKPFQKQLQIKEAKIACGMSVAVSCMLSWPSLVFYQSVDVNVTASDNLTLIGHDCTTTKSSDYKIYLTISNGFYVICFLISAISLCVLYFLVGRVLFRHTTKSTMSFSGRKVHRPPESSETEFTDIDQSSSNQSECIVNKNVENDYGTTSGHVANNQGHRKQHVHLDKKNVRFTMVMFVITVVYILSFLPHLAITLWRAIVGKYEGDILSDGELLAVQIGLRSFFLNSAINPFVYGFFNPKFRQYFYIKLCPCSWHEEFTTTSSTSGDK